MAIGSGDLSRRRFLAVLSGAGVAAGVSLLAACGGAAAPSVPAPAAQATAPAAAAATTAPAAPTAAPTPASAAAPTIAPGAAAAATTAPSTAAAAAPSGPGPVYSPINLKGKTMTLWGLDYAPHKDRWAEILPKFSALTGLQAKVDAQAWPLETKVIAAAAANNLPDAVSMMGRVLAPVVPPKNNLLEPMDTVFSQMKLDPKTWFTPGAIQAYLYDGKYWGVPQEDNQVSTGVFSRSDWIQQAGAQDLWPETQGKDIFDDYDSLFALAKKLQVESGGRVTRWGLNSEGWNRTSVFGIMKMLGTDWWDDNNKKFNMDSDAAVRAIDLMIGIPAQKLKIEAELAQTGQDAFAQGKVAVARASYGALTDAPKNKIPLVGVAAPPAEKGGKVIYVGEGGWGVTVPVKAKNKDAALEFSKYLCTYEGQKLWSVIYGGAQPSCNALRDDPMYQGDGADGFNPIRRRWLKYQPETIYMGTGFGSEDTITGLWEKIGDDVRSGKITSQQASKTAQQQFTNHYQEFYKK